MDLAHSTPVRVAHLALEIFAQHVDANELKGLVRVPAACAAASAPTLPTTALVAQDAKVGLVRGQAEHDQVGVETVDDVARACRTRDAIARLSEHAFGGP